MNIFVTGANGFSGRHLVATLEAAGHAPTAVVRKPSGFSKEVIADLGELVPADFTHIFGQADVVFHLAAEPDFRLPFKESVYNVNGLATLQLINALKKDCHFIFASNALISGIREPHITIDTPDNPEIPYNIAKWMAEEYATRQLEHYTILRIGGIYGLGGPSHLFLNTALNKMVHERAIPTLNNDGKGRRNYLYVKDLCNIMLEIMQQRRTGKFVLAGNEILGMADIFNTAFDVLLKRHERIAVNDQPSADQVIEPNYAFRGHTYREAFTDMLAELAPAK